MEVIEIPAWVAAVLTALVAASFAYGIIVTQSLATPLLFWVGVIVIGLSVFTVYLLYRAVVAFEKIADKY